MTSLTLLHLSDLRFGPRRRFGSEEPFDTGRRSLIDDLDHLREQHGLRPDVLVVTGDLSEEGLKSEFDQALELVEDLGGFLALDRGRVVTVPGDHDVNLKLCQAYFNRCEGREDKPQSPYRPKWEPYAGFFRAFYRDHPGVTFSEDEPWTLYAIDDLRLVVAGLNSTMAESHRPEDHYGYLGTEQLHWFRKRLEPYRRPGWLRIAALHHPLDDLRDQDDLRAILGPYLNLVLHGHDRKPYRLGLQVPVLSTGGTGKESQSGYQIVRILADRLVCHRREYRPEQKRWTAAGDAEVELRVDFEDRGPSPTSSEKGPEPYREERGDDFLARVEPICRLREPEGAEIRRVREPSGIDYLSVTFRDGGIARIHAVGAVADALRDEELDAFLAVHRRYQAADSGDVISTLVHGGEPPSPELARRAAAARVRLQSFVDYQKLIEFRPYLDQQTRRLAADPVYPPELYVPQRLRYRIGQDEDEGDALDTLNVWLTDPYGRFVLLLGDFGTGKTFLLHELARRLGEEGGPLTPILIEMRALEKARTFDQLVAQHLAGAGMERIDLKAFHYLLEERRIALLFDGFDELAVRVTYDRADAHFATLLDAARGEAKVVVTSRTQHFESDRQVSTAFAERVELLAGHRIARLRSFEDPQIRRFLVNRLGDEAAAEARYRLIDEVRDLLGLSHNPRLLGFIAELNEDQLRAAKEKEGEITSAGLYRLLLERWLVYEYERHQPPGAPPALTVEERWAAVTHLAVRLWQKTERAINVNELTGEMAEAITSLAESALTKGVAAHQVGSGTLLVRDAEGGFSFIHQSVLEWLVARQAAGESEVLGVREMSPLMADFFCSLAGREGAGTWAWGALAAGAGETARKNALLVLDRLGEEIRQPMQAAGQDLRGQDLAGKDLSGSDLTGADLTSARLTGARLRGARLAGTKLVTAELSRADLRGADLRKADLSGARLLGADLSEARLEGALLRRAKLVGAVVDEGALRPDQLFGAALPSPVVVAPLVATASPCNAVAWSAVGDLLATGHDDGSVRLWEVATGLEVQRLLGHEDRVWSMAWSPDGQLLASGSYDQTVGLWEVGTGRRVRTLTGHLNGVLSVAWSPDGQLLASGSDDQTVGLWEVPTGHRARTLTGHLNGVLSVAWSPDGRLLASGSDDKTVGLWEVPTGRRMGTLTDHKHPVLSVAWSPDGRLLASGSYDQTVGLWEVGTGRRVRSLTGHKNWVLSVAWSPDGRLLASGSYDQTVGLWEAATGRRVRTLTGHQSPVLSVAWSPDGRLMASGSDDRTVSLWEVPTGRQVRALTGHMKGVLSVAWSPDGRLLGSGSDDKNVGFWQAATGRSSLTGHQSPVLSVAWSPDGRLLASGSSDQTVGLWEPATGHWVGTLIGHKGRVRSVAWSPDGRLLASASDDQTVGLWAVPTERRVRTLTGHQDLVRSVAWSPDGRLLASGSYDQTVGLWEVPTGRRVQTLTGHKNWVLSVAWSPDGRLLASGSEDQTVGLWEVATGRRVRTLTGHQNGVLGVTWSPDGRQVASSSKDGTARVWDVDDGRCLAILVPLPEGWVAYTPDGRYKLGGDTAGFFWHSIGLCRFEPGELDPYLPSSLRVPDEEPLIPC